jgi:hypothetical protein
MRIPKGPLNDSVSKGYTMTDHDDRGRTARGPADQLDRRELRRVMLRRQPLLPVVRDKAAFADSIDVIRADRRSAGPAKENESER